MTDAHLSQLALINSLLSEKDRLINERDELAHSKDRLWRELHRMVCERDAKSERLRQENATLRTRCAALEKALRELLNEADAESNAEGNEPKSKKYAGEAVVGDELAVSTKGEGVCASVDNRDDSPESEGLFIPELAAQPHSMPDEVGFGRRSSDSGLLSSPRQSMDSLTDLSRRGFTFSPLIDVTQEGAYELGSFEHIATPIIQSICATLTEIDRRHRQGQLPAMPTSSVKAICCAWLWAIHHQNNVRWSVDSPKTFACYSCFNAKRTCFLWLGSMKWMILPLPPQVRDSSATLEEAGYYIYSGSEHARNFSGLWEESNKKKRKLRNAGL